LNRPVKICVFAGLVLCAMALTYGYSAAQARVPTEATGVSSARAVMCLGGLVVTVVVLGVLCAYEVAHYFGERAERTFIEPEIEPELPVRELEEAERVRKQGEPLDAIRLLREYLQEHPTELRAMSRIAEIYNYDLKNYLAAALEYEEFLKHRMPAEQWAWAAVHLAKLYGRLNQHEKSVALLERLDKHYGKTAGGARARRALREARGEPQPEETEEEAEEEKGA
jgi:hypothetical protein